MGPLCCWCRRLVLRDRRGIRGKGSRRVMAAGHRPVMLERAVAALGLAPEDSVVDATFGGGGHSRLILAGLGLGGRLVGIDRDPEAAGRASDLLEDPRFEFVSDAYDLALWAMVEEGAGVDAILFDLGLSSFQVDEPGRGFTYMGEGPLDMRMDPRWGTACGAGGCSETTARSYDGSLRGRTGGCGLEAEGRQPCEEDLPGRESQGKRRVGQPQPGPGGLRTATHTRWEARGHNVPLGGGSPRKAIHLGA